MHFPRTEIIQIIAEAQMRLGITKAEIFRKAKLSPTNHEKWEKGTSPTRRTENKILDAIEKIAKAKEKKHTRASTRSNTEQASKKVNNFLTHQ